MANETTTGESYAVIDAEGYHGDWTRVYATFDTEVKAKNYAKRGTCRVLKGCDKPKGARIAQGVLQAMIDGGWWKVV